MAINVVEFSELEEKLRKTHKSPSEYLAPKSGRAYVITITRDNCPACKKQKPKLDKLAKLLVEKHGDKVVFNRIHIKYSSDSVEESLRSKDLLKHYFYPTNLILFRTRDKGAVEYYRNAAPTMNELKRNVERAVETAVMLAKEADE